MQLGETIKKVNEMTKEVAEVLARPAMFFPNRGDTVICYANLVGRGYATKRTEATTIRRVGENVLLEFMDKSREWYDVRVIAAITGFEE
jgi:hypothetical protein